MSSEFEPDNYRWAVRPVKNGYAVFAPGDFLWRVMHNFEEAVQEADRQARTLPVELWPTAAPLALEDDTRVQLCTEYIGSGETLRWVNIYNRFAGTQQPIDVLDCLPLARWLLKVHYTLMQEGVIPATD